MAQPPAHPVAVDRRTKGTPDGESQPNAARETMIGDWRRAEDYSGPQRAGATILPGEPQKLELAPMRQPVDHALRRWRPFWRRDRRTARPPRVLARSRKPCFLERFR